MFALPRRAVWFWLLVTAVGCACLSWSLRQVVADLHLLPSAALLALAAAIAESFRVRMPSTTAALEHVDISVSAAVCVAAMLILPLPWVAPVVAASVLMAQAVTRRSAWYKVAFNAAQYTLTAVAAALVWRLYPSGGTIGTADAVPPVLGAVAAYFAVNTLLVSGIVAYASGLPFRVTWWRNWWHALPAYLGMLFVGVLVAVLWFTSPWAIMLAVLPLTGLYYALRNAVNLQTQTLEALFNLAEILDDRDRYTHGHSLRVGAYAQQAALAMGASADQAYVIFLAGRLHDIGKCAVNNEVLLKPGALSTDERDHMCRHAAVGGSMLAHFALFTQVAGYVRHHHERWDGDGYPDGVAGESIPWGARVIAVVDSYDAMTTTRPYREALPEAEALRRLREGAGTQWDPIVVDAFLQLLRDRAAETAAAPASGGAFQAPTPRAA